MAKSRLNGALFGRLCVEYIDGNAWRLYQIRGEEFGLKLSTGYTIVPDDGFIFDFASIPRPARWVYPKVGTGKGGAYGPAGAIHDWLYSYPGILDRRYCDKIFLLAMELKSVRHSMRSFFYRAVRIGGKRFFGKPDKLNKLRGTTESPSEVPPSL